MGILDSIERRASVENPSVPLSSPDAFSVIFGDDFKSSAGVNVSVEAALGVPAYGAGVNFLGNSIASLPLQLFRANGNSSEVLRSDPLYTLIHDVVNEDRLTSFKWRKLQMTTVLTTGRAFTYIERNNAGRPANLWPLNPNDVKVKRNDNRTTYEVKDGDRTIVYTADQIIDLPFMMCADGVAHRAPVSTFRNALGLAIALEDYASRFFRNGGVPPLALHGPQASPGAVRRATTAIDDAVKRASEQNRNMLYLPLGHELKQIGFNPEQGQLILARLLQLQEIARILSLPPVFLQDLSHGTYTNTEQQDLHFVKHTLGHWLELWEQELNAKLFPPSARGRFVEFNVDGLLRGDFKTRMDGMAQAIQNGLRTPDELRNKDNLPPLPGGDRLYIQGATVPLEQAGIKQTAAPAAEGDHNGEE